MALASKTPILGYQPASSTPSQGVSFPSMGKFLYWPDMKNLTGGTPSTDLDAQPIGSLPADTMILVEIADRGASMWQRQVDATSPATDLDAGVILPTDYNSLTNPYVLRRQSGF